MVSTGISPTEISSPILATGLEHARHRYIRGSGSWEDSCKDDFFSVGAEGFARKA